MPEFIGCQVCGRVLYPEDGPVCVFCRPAEPEPKPSKKGEDKKADDGAEA